MRKLFTLLILMCCAIGMNAASYNIWVKGIQVNDDNKNDILNDGKGKVKYDSSNNILSFDNVSINSNTSGTNQKTGSCLYTLKALTICIKGDVTLTSYSSYSAVYLMGGYNVTFSTYAGNETDANLQIKASEDALTYGGSGTLQFRMMNVDITSGDKAIKTDSSLALKLYNCDFSVTGGTESSPIYGPKSIETEGTSITNSELTYDTSAHFFRKNGSQYKGTISWEATKYGIKVAGKDVTIRNKKYILGDKDATVTFDSDANILTLNNATISATGGNEAIYTESDLTIDLVGTNNLTTQNATVIKSKRSTTGKLLIKSSNGNAVLNATSSANLALFPNECPFTIENCTVNAKGYSYGICGEESVSPFIINNATVTAEGPSGSIKDFKSITLNGVEIASPEGAKISGGKVVDANGNLVKTKVTIKNVTYGLEIAGTKVTTENASNITGTGISGTVSYDRASKTLTLNNATIDGGSKSAIEAREDITVKLIGSNTISRSTGAPFATEGNATITSSSNGTLTSNTSGGLYNFLIGNDAKTTIENCTVNINGGKSGIEDYTGSGDLPTLVINNANVNIDAGSYAVYRLKSLTLSNCYYYYPSNAVFQSAKGYITTGSSVCSDLQIKAGQLTKYGFTVAGTEVTNANANDVLCDGGKVKYDNSTKTLTLNNATINTDDKSGIMIQNFGSAFKIQLIGTNKIKSTKYNGIYASSTPLEISGSSNATLEVSSNDETSNGYSPILIYGSGNLTVSNCKITTNNKNYGIRAKGTSNTITLDGATINGNVTANSVFAGALAGFKNINLKNSTIKSTSCGIYTKDMAASINLDGTNEITSTEAHGMMLEGTASTTSTISSKTGGSLDITATSNGMCEIMFGTSLLVKDCTLTGRGYSAGLSGQTEWQNLTIDNATVKARATDNSSAVGAIDGISKLELKNGIQIISPKGAAYNSSLYGIAKDGALCKYVEIGVEGYSIKVDGKDVTSQNCNDILGDGGKVKFNPETNTLTLNNATITSSNQALNIGVGAYTLDLIGNNTITGTKIGLAVALGTLNITSSTGTGKLTCSAAASGDATGAIATALGIITIENCTVEAKNSVGIAINGLEAGALTIKNANVTANGKEACIAGFTELNLEGCYIDEPGGAEIKAEGNYKSVYLAGSYAKDQNVVIKSGDNPHIVPPTIPSTLVNVSNLTHESFSLSWTAATDNDTPQSDIVYFITYTNKTTGEMLTKEVTGETTATIGGLASETTYEVTLRAYDKDGNNALYGTLNVITSVAPDVTAPILPTDAQIAVTDVTTKSVTISWNAATDDRSTADAINYKVEWNIGDTFVNSTTLNGSTTTYEILNLNPETEYTITVTAIDEAGNTADYTPLKVSTLAEVDETAPSLPADATIYVNEATEKSLTIAWFAASDDKTDASKLQYEVNILVNGEWKTLPIVTGATTCKIEDLEPGTEYKIAVYVYDEAGNSMCYDVLTTSTEAVDAIDAILADNPDVKMYNTSGVLVGKNYRGVVIINGKKYMKTK